MIRPGGGGGVKLSTGSTQVSAKFQLPIEGKRRIIIKKFNLCIGWYFNIHGQDKLYAQLN